VDAVRTLLDGLVQPAQVALVRGSVDLIHLLIRGVVELLADFTGGRILDALAADSTAYVDHDRLLRLWHLFAPLSHLHPCAPHLSTDCVCLLHTLSIRDVCNKGRNLGESSVPRRPRSHRRGCADSVPATTVSAQPSRLPGSVEATGGADL